MKTKMFFEAPKRGEKLKAEVGVPLIANPLISKLINAANRFFCPELVNCNFLKARLESCF